jgi:hypothetical protein
VFVNTVTYSEHVYQNKEIKYVCTYNAYA